MPSIRRGGLALAVTAVALVGTAACSAGTSTTSSGTGSTPETNSAAPTPSETPMPSQSAQAADAMGNLVGPGCAAYAKAVPDGAGSVSGMAQDPVATAASNNPLLKTLTAAVSGKVNPKVDLVDTLNGGKFTVFAPVDKAFEKVPAATLKELGTPKGADTLTKVLTYHVLPGQIAPDAIDGKHKTVEGDMLEVKGSGDDITVNGNAKVICGGVQTANATVYLIDTLLMPPAK